MFSEWCEFVSLVVAGLWFQGCFARGGGLQDECGLCSDGLRGLQGVA